MKNELWRVIIEDVEAKEIYEYENVQLIRRDKYMAVLKYIIPVPKDVIEEFSEFSELEAHPDYLTFTVFREDGCVNERHYTWIDMTDDELFESGYTEIDCCTMQAKRIEKMK